VVVNAGSGLTWSLSNAQLSVHGDWHYKYRLGFIDIRDSGSFDVDLSGASSSLSVTLGATSAGEPTIQSTGCSCHISDLKIHLHGGASWLYDLFVGFVENPMRDQVQSLICNAARKAVDSDAARELSTLQVRVVIDHQWLLDYRLVSAPVFGSGYMESFHKGEFFFVGQEVEVPFEPKVLPSLSVTNKMVTFVLSDFVLNTLGYVLHQHGVLKYSFTSKDLPPDQRFYLNTTCCPSCKCIGKFLSAVAEAYPDASVEAMMSTSEPPVVVINPTSVTGSMSGTVSAGARLSNGSLAHVFTLKVSAEISILPTLNGSLLVATVSQISETISVVDSSVGPVSAAVLKFFFDYIKKAFIIPQLNKVGSHGFPIPHVDHVQFTNVGLELMQNCVVVSSDVKYSQALYFVRH
jgi:lipopolysaccharide-binding protein